MKQTVKLLLISAFLVAGLVALVAPRRQSMDGLLARMDREFPEVAQVATAELAKDLESGAKVALFDVRTREEFEVGHLPGAVLLEAGSSAKKAKGVIEERAGAGTNVVLYCSVGYRAAQMAEALQGAGWTNAVVLRGSIFQWAKEGRTLAAPGGAAPLVHPHSISYAHLVPEERRLELPGSTLLWNHFPRASQWRLGIGVGLLALFLVWESITPAFGWFKNRRERFAHGWRNYLLGFINVILVGLFFVQLWLLATKWVDRNNFGLLNLLEWPTWARMGIAILVLDAWTYGWHWLNHHIRFLWRFHRTHHSEMQMDVTSAVRFHFGEIAMSGLLRVPLILALGLEFKELLVYETLLFAIVQFHHANIRLPLRLEKMLSWLIVSPGFHRVHHSSNPAEFNSNYSSILTIWDRLFRTRARKLVVNGDGTDGFHMGVRQMNRPEQQTLVGMVESPLERV